MQRMISEAILIRKAENNASKTVMNNRIEFSRTVLPDLNIKALTHKEIQEEAEIDAQIDKLRKEKMLKRKQFN